MAGKAKKTVTRTRKKMPAAVSSFSALMHAMKRRGPSELRELAEELGISYEGVRQQIADLIEAGWVTAAPAASQNRPGPAAQQYRLSNAGEHFFPKHYDALSAELIEHVVEQFGASAIVGILKRMTQQRVARWAPLLETLPVKDRLKALCSLYEDKDAYMELRWDKSAPLLIERNCPFLNIAQAHPAVCSVSVNTLEQLLGFKVVRERKFQNGDGHCAFRIRLDQPVSKTSFELESTH